MAAGLGFKTFTTGEVLTAADVNGYLMQGVLVFASEAARDAAITSPQEGQFAYTKDNNSLWYYTGSVWAASGATGDIEGVTAGTGISGGGTSGTETITNSMATEIDAKGDLVAGTGADAFARIGVGADGTVLTAASGEATGLQWAAPAGGGKVLQVIFADNAVTATSTSSTFADTGLTATITPTLATSKILVLVNQEGCFKSNSATATAMALRLLRGATTIFNIDESICYTGDTAYATESVGASYLDNPATTSATTYKTQFAAGNSVGSVSVNKEIYAAFVPRSNITLLEIGV